MAAAIDDEVLDHFVVTGSWQELPDRLIERYSGIADRIVLYFAGMAWQRNPASLKSWGDVATAVRDATGASGTGGAA